MKVKELIQELQKMPQDADVVMFDGPAYFTPSHIFVAENFSDRINGSVIVD